MRDLPFTQGAAIGGTAWDHLGSKPGTRTISCLSEAATPARRWLSVEHFVAGPDPRFARLSATEIYIFVMLMNVLGGAIVLVLVTMNEAGPVSQVRGLR